MRAAEKEGQKLATDTRTDAFTAITELTLFAPNHPRLLALFAGACAAAGANIAGAHIMTTRDGYRARYLPADREFQRGRGRAAPRRRIGEPSSAS